MGSHCSDATALRCLTGYAVDRPRGHARHARLGRRAHAPGRSRPASAYVEDGRAHLDALSIDSIVVPRKWQLELFDVGTAGAWLEDHG